MIYINSRKIHGFTLIELTVVLLIAGILLSYAIPSYRDFGLRQKVSNEANGLLGDLMYARATAIKEGQSVSVNTISTTNNWAGGWTIRLVTDNILLRQKDAVNKAISLAGTNSSVVFNNFGAATTVNTITIAHSDVTKSVVLDVSPSGMVSSREP
jgi:prepilin-type N-terminal cleavage/methylation domain-containing protein